MKKTNKKQNEDGNGESYLLYFNGMSNSERVGEIIIHKIDIEERENCQKDNHCHLALGLIYNFKQEAKGGA